MEDIIYSYIDWLYFNKFVIANKNAYIKRVKN